MSQRAPQLDRLLQRLHPLTKLAGAALAIVLTYTLPWALTPLIVFALVLMIAGAAGVAGGLLRPVLLIVLPVALSLFLIQGIFFPPYGATPLPLGPIQLTYEGLLFAYLISARLLALATTVLLLLRVTHPADLVNALTERGLPRNIGYILLVSLQIVPDMSARATAIVEAQRSRGLETQRGLRRVHGVIPLVGPLIVGALVDVEERAMALESRAFFASGPRTALRMLPDTPAQRAVRLLVWLLVIGLVIWRIAGLSVEF